MVDEVTVRFFVGFVMIFSFICWVYHAGVSKNPYSYILAWLFYFFFLVSVTYAICFLPY